MKAPAKDVLRQGGGNVYVGNPRPAEAVRLAASTGSHSWGWSEGTNIVDECRTLDRYRLLTALGFEDMRDANDCIMLVRKDVNVRHTSMTAVSKDQQPEAKIDQNRAFAMLAYEAPMIDAVACHIAIHPNWIVGIDAKTNPVVVEYVKSMKRLDAMLTFAKDMGWIVTVSGDFNTRQGDAKPFRTVFDVFREHRMTVRMEGIDGMAWDRRLTLADWTTFGRGRTHSDHDAWTVADFKRKRAAR